MWFPKNPKVLVVDDRLDEIAPLLKIFSLEGIPYVYYDGKEDVPEHPFSSIRLVVLDVELEGRTNSMQDDKTVASTLCTYLNSLIDIENSSYSILFWTKRPNVIENVIQYLSDCKGAPITYKNMEKPAAKDLNIDYVKSKFFSDFGENTFEFLINWENSITQDATKFINEMSNVVRKNSIEKHIAWDDSIKSILSKLAYSYTGTSEKHPLGENAILYATNVLCQSFAESLSHDLHSIFELPTEPNVSLSTIASLNSILFVAKTNDSKIENGKVFLDSDDPEIFELIKKDIISQKQLSTCEFQPISVVITPSCDLAHDKFLKTANSEYHQILSGLKVVIKSGISSDYFEYAASLTSNRNRVSDIIELDQKWSESFLGGANQDKIKEIFGEEADEKIKDITKKIKITKELHKRIKSFVVTSKPENLFITSPFIDEDSVCVMAFHFCSIRTKKLNASQIQFKYHLKNSLISDLQSKLANHVNRLGNSMLEC